ncbi:MAG: hypothetical protein HY760_02740 [Nitrospirae bacterium]|nr:hypothetical protein [Nitrospirota bacterium]
MKRHCIVSVASVLFVFCFAFLGTGSFALAQGGGDADSDYGDYTSQTSPNQVFPSAITYIARGNVSETGALSASQNVTSVTWNAVDSFWEIQLAGAGANYYYLNFDTLVSTYGAGLTGTLRSAVYDSVSGKLVVAIWESGGKVKKGFSFVVLK